MGSSKLPKLQLPKEIFLSILQYYIYNIVL